MFETGSDRRVFCPASSATCGKHSGDGERNSGLARKVFGIAPERRSPSARNRVRNQPGIAFGFIPEWRSRSPGFPTGRRVKVMPQLKVDQGITAARTIFGKCFFDAEKCAD